MEQSPDHPSISGFSSTPSVNIAPKTGRNALGIPPGFSAYRGSSDASLFSSSLPVLPHEKLNSIGLEHEHRSIDDACSKLEKLATDVDSKDSTGELDLLGLGVSLPDDVEELLAGIADDFSSFMTNQAEDTDDLFGSGGGLELDFDPLESPTVGVAKTSVSDGYSGNGGVPYGMPNGISSGIGAVATEHPYGEHPSRTLFVRNINSTVGDSELRALFEEYGDIRTLYTACKHRGFVMISYYDIRDARTAMRQLQHRAVRRRKLDIHFSIPKENPPEKDINQGTLVVFNLDPSVTNDDLRQIFGAYGEVKEIRETPHKRHHKFIEFYDVRAAEAALRSLNRSDIAGKRIKLEPSRPGGARRNLIQQLNQDIELDETRNYRQQVGSPITNSPPGNWAQFSSPNDNIPLRAFSQSPTFGTGIPIVNNYMPGVASVLPSMMSNSLKIGPIGRDKTNHANHVFSGTNSHHGFPSQYSRSFPVDSGIAADASSQSCNFSSFGPSTSSMTGVGTLTGAQFLWGSPISYSEPRTSAWPNSSMAQSFKSSGLGQRFPNSSCQGSFVATSHHVGSAPSGVPYEGHFSYFPESSESPFVNQVALGSMGISRNEGNVLMNMGNRGRHVNSGVTLSGNMHENGSPGFRMSPRLGQVFPGSSPVPGSGFSGAEGLFERGRGRRVDNNASQLDNKKQFQLDLEKIVHGEDTRTTLMLKNIPNKYTSKMLLAAIDERHKGTYDFLYLPIDFKNKCNVGYAFINLVSPSHIVPFYQDFNGKKWEKFNSEKVASLAYARIQGREALVTHFQNSSLLSEDKNCRPILFHSEGQEALDQKDMQELVSANGLNFCADGALSEDAPESLTTSCPSGKPDEASVPGIGSE